MQTDAVHRLANQSGVGTCHKAQVHETPTHHKRPKPRRGGVGAQAQPWDTRVREKKARAEAHQTGQATSANSLPDPINFLVYEYVKYLCLGYVGSDTTYHIHITNEKIEENWRIFELYATFMHAFMSRPPKYVRLFAWEKGPLIGCFWERCDLYASARSVQFVGNPPYLKLPLIDSRSTLCAVSLCFRA